MPPDLRQDITGSNLILQGTRSIPCPLLHADETLNDSDKDIAVPSGTLWLVTHCYIRYTATAVVGNRFFVFTVRNTNNDPIFAVSGLNNIVASEYKEITIYNTGFDITEIDTAKTFVPAPLPMYLLPGYDLRFKDNTAVDPAADDMLVYISGLQWSI